MLWCNEAGFPKSVNDLLGRARTTVEVVVDGAIEPVGRQVDPEHTITEGVVVESGLREVSRLTKRDG